MWARIMKERFKAKDSRSCMLRFHTETAGCTLTSQQPMNNVIRVTTQALSAVLGGMQSLHTSSYDEAYAPPSEDAVTVALRTQQVIGYESGVADTVDPLGDSYFIEHLTDSIESEATKYIQKIDALGGAIAVIEQGFQQREIQESSYRYQKEVESEKRAIVGVNKFVSLYPPIAGLLKVNSEQARVQLARLVQVKKTRDNARVKATPGNLKNVATGSANTMPAILECVEAYASLGEICDVLRSVFGIQKEYLVV